MSYAARIQELFKGVHADVKPLFDPATQKRQFPRGALANFLKKKDIREAITGTQPDEITKLLNSTDKLNLIPSEILSEFLAGVWDSVPENIQKAIAGAQDPHAPSQGASNFIINRELGDWAEGVVRVAVNKSGLDVCAVSYGRQDRLIAGEDGFVKLYLEHQQELKGIGKRPDLLVFRKPEMPQGSFEGESANDLISIAKKAVAALEVRSSQQTLDGERDPAKLSFTPKVEDVRNVVMWIEIHDVPHYYVQVLFGRVYAIGFDRILELLAQSPKSKKYRIVRFARNQFKSTIYIPLTSGVCLSTEFEQPQLLKASFKQLGNGRVVVVVEFSGGKVVFDKAELQRIIEAADAAKRMQAGQSPPA